MWGGPPGFFSVFLVLSGFFWLFLFLSVFSVCFWLFCCFLVFSFFCEKRPGVPQTIDYSFNTVFPTKHCKLQGSVWLGKYVFARFGYILGVKNEAKPNHWRDFSVTDIQNTVLLAFLGDISCFRLLLGLPGRPGDPNGLRGGAPPRKAPGARPRKAQGPRKDPERPE